MSKKSNVHPDHYKTDGRDRPDDAARARLNRAIAAKVTSQQRPDRMGKEFYFERPESTTPPPQPTAAGEPGNRAGRKPASRPGAAKKAGARKAVARKGGARKASVQTRKSKPRKTATPRKAASSRRTRSTSTARQTKKR